MDGGGRDIEGGDRRQRSRGCRDPEGNVEMVADEGYVGGDGEQCFHQGVLSFKPVFSKVGRDQ